MSLWTPDKSLWYPPRLSRRQPAVPPWVHQRFLSLNRVRCKCCTPPICASSCTTIPSSLLITCADFHHGGVDEEGNPSDRCDGVEAFNGTFELSLIANIDMWADSSAACLGFEKNTVNPNGCGYTYQTPFYSPAFALYRSEGDASHTGYGNGKWYLYGTTNVAPENYTDFCAEFDVTTACPPDAVYGTVTGLSGVGLEAGWNAYSCIAGTVRIDWP